MFQVKVFSCQSDHHQHASRAAALNQECVNDWLREHACDIEVQSVQTCASANESQKMFYITVVYRELPKA